MKQENKIYGFFLHYGISFVLLFMLVGIAYMLQTIEIKNKVSVDVFFDKDFSAYTAYVSKNNQFHSQVNKLIQIDTSDRMHLSFKVLAIREESSFFVLQLLPQNKSVIVNNFFAGNTKYSGYIFTNKIKLWDLIFSKWVNLH